MIELLTKTFSIDYTYVTYFILTLKGMELLLKAPMKGICITQLTKLSIVILQDTGLIKAQIEAKLKKAVYDYTLL